ncbi:MAG TPA: tyrosine-type recombinase/integrase [Ktedonobacterales bacterium]|nr:tyrosine-type recombinase/integrase [Ktedonobacterales bacterium]
MKVQRIRLPDTARMSWMVLDDAYLPIQPVVAFLTFLEDTGRSPNTIRSAAHHLKLFWEYLRDSHLDWTDVDVRQLAAFIAWLRASQPGVDSIAPQDPRRTDATIDQILTAIHGFYDFHMRLKTVPDLALYDFLQMPHRRYKPFLFGIAKVKPVRRRVVRVKREQRRIKTITVQQAERLIGACTTLRDKFLLTLLFETGMRIGQALGLRHEDIREEENQVHIVPREDNVNGARAKTTEAYQVPVENTRVMRCYTEYLFSELNALEAEVLPDYVFINLWAGEIGRPLTYAAVASLFRRLERKTGIHITPHMFRHTRATTWIREEVPLPVVSRLLGHKSIATTEAIYVERNPEDLRKALKQAKHKEPKYEG